MKEKRKIRKKNEIKRNTKKSLITRKKAHLKQKKPRKT
jgi:hypothetical protein